jgi:hypothetical protein
MTNLIERLIQLEADVLYQEEANGQDSEFILQAGRIPVLVSAPHGAVHRRVGKWKEEDEYTAGFARLLGELTGAHVMYSRRRSRTDPNWYPKVAYKQSLRDAVAKDGIGFVMDIHGACEERKFAIGIGTLRGVSCPYLPKILEVLASHGFSEGSPDPLNRVDVDKAFPATGSERQETVTRFVWHALQVPVAQFELNARVRIPIRRSDATAKGHFEGDHKRICRCLAAISDMVVVVADRIHS